MIGKVLLYVESSIVYRYSQVHPFTLSLICYKPRRLMTSLLFVRQWYVDACIYYMRYIPEQVILSVSIDFRQPRKPVAQVQLYRHRELSDKQSVPLPQTCWLVRQMSPAEVQFPRTYNFR